MISGQYAVPGGITGARRASVPSWMALLAAGAAFFLLALLLQMRMNAFGSEFGFDEDSHYVSGLLIHDYIAALRPQSPVAFLKEFHSAYPLVGIGHWGPFWYCVEAAWMLVFGTSRASILLLSAATVTVVATLLYALIAPRFGRVLAAFAGLACVASPIMQEGTAAVMLDIPITLLCLLAMLAWWRFTETGRAGFSALFGLLASAAMLTKGNAAGLALLPPLMLLLDGKWHLLRRWQFWLPVPIVALLVGPWYAFTYDLVAAGFRFRWGWDYSSVAIPANTRIMLAAFGPLALSVGVAGVLLAAWHGRRMRQDGLVSASAALFAAIVIFQSVAPAAIQDRYLAPAVPPLLILAAYAIAFVVRSASGRAIAAGVLVAAALPWILATTPKPRSNMIEAADRVWSVRLPANPSVLLATDSAAEGSAVAELAMDDPARPSLFAVRGTRLLGAGGYNSDDYEPRYRTPEEVMAAIDAYAIPLVVLRNEQSGRKWRHLDLVSEAARRWPERWEEIARFEGSGAPAILYRIRGNDTATLDRRKLMALTGPAHLGGE